MLTNYLRFVRMSFSKSPVVVTISPLMMTVGVEIERPPCVGVIAVIAVTYFMVSPCYPSAVSITTTRPRFIEYIDNPLRSVWMGVPMSASWLRT